MGIFGEQDCSRVTSMRTHFAAVSISGFIKRVDKVIKPGEDIRVLLGVRALVLCQSESTN